MATLHIELEGDTLRFTSSVLMEIQVVSDNPQKSSYDFTRQEPAMSGEYHKPCKGLILTPKGTEGYIDVFWGEYGRVSVCSPVRKLGEVTVGECLDSELEMAGQEVQG